ncbi:hypothetical protein O9992_05270 [Vibrio lentus]|nr:hypothetical protein [Vibrio lentus]
MRLWFAGFSCAMCWCLRNDFFWAFGIGASSGVRPVTNRGVEFIAGASGWHLGGYARSCGRGYPTDQLLFFTMQKHFIAWPDIVVDQRVNNEIRIDANLAMATALNRYSTGIEWMNH